MLRGFSNGNLRKIYEWKFPHLICKFFSFLRFIIDAFSFLSFLTNSLFKFCVHFQCSDFSFELPNIFFCYFSTIMQGYLPWGCFGCRALYFLRMMSILHFSLCYRWSWRWTKNKFNSMHKAHITIESCSKPWVEMTEKFGPTMLLLFQRSNVICVSRSCLISYVEEVLW